MFTIQQIADAFYYAYGITLSLYRSKEKDVVRITETDIDICLLFQYSQLRKQSLEYRQQTEQEGVPSREQELRLAWVNFNELNCGWAYVWSVQDACYYLLGPVLLGALADESVMKHYFSIGVGLKEARRLAQEYHKIPVMNFAVFWNQFLYLGRLLGVKEIRTVGMGSYQSTRAEVHFNEEEYYQSQQRDFYVGLRSEKFMLDCVRRGDVDRLEANDFHALEELSVLGDTELRSMKNTMITAVTTVTRAAMEGGLAVELAFPLSDMYILQLENAQNIAEVARLFRKALLDFTMHVKECHYKVEYSRKVRACCDYIDIHVMESVRLKDAADEVNLNPEYLSRLFKKETGISVPDYIRRKKVEEAQFRILHSEDSLTDIAFQLGYKTQGRFIEDFKKVTGELPSRFRERNGNICKN